MDESASLSPLLAGSLTLAAAVVGVLARTALVPLVRRAPRAEWGAVFAGALVLGALVGVPLEVAHGSGAPLASSLGASTMTFAGASAALVLLRRQVRTAAAALLAAAHALNALLGGMFGLCLVVLLPHLQA